MVGSPENVYQKQVEKQEAENARIRSAEPGRGGTVGPAKQTGRSDDGSERVSRPGETGITGSSTRDNELWGAIGGVGEVGNEVVVPAAHDGSQLDDSPGRAGHTQGTGNRHAGVTADGSIIPGAGFDLAGLAAINPVVKTPTADDLRKHHGIIAVLKSALRAEKEAKEMPDVNVKTPQYHEAPMSALGGGGVGTLVATVGAHYIPSVPFEVWAGAGAIIAWAVGLLLKKMNAPRAQ